VDEISRYLYHWVREVGGVPNLLWQEPKTLLDPMDKAVRAALRGYNSGNVLRMVSEPYAEAILKRVQAFGASPRQATLTFDGEPKLSPQWQRHWETMR
jgi:hypothetical protein